MKMPVAVIKNWVDIISDDCMHFSESAKEYAVLVASNMDFYMLPNEEGFIAYSILKDLDCKKKLYVLILYCKPEYRGRYLATMFNIIENIAKQEGVSEIMIGKSISGYKENKFNRMLEHFGFHSSGYSKEL